MYILYFGCLATNSLDCFVNTLLCATNSLDCFVNTLLCVAMAAKLAMYILQKVCLCAAGYNLGYMNKTLFACIAFGYLILTFKVKRAAKNTRYFLET